MINLKNKIEFENECWIGLVNTDHYNLTKQNRIFSITDIASITKGKLGLELLDTIDNLASKRLSLYEKLKIESAGNPSTPFEFIPITFIENINKLNFTFLKYSNILNFDNSLVEIYTDYRNYLINNPFENNLDNIYNTNEEIKNFKIIVGYIPWKVISHLRTHRSFSFLVESSRNKRYLNDIKFWYPSWWTNNIKTKIMVNDEQLVSGLKNLLQEKYYLYNPEDANMELSDRRLVHFAMAAWTYNTDSWNNLFKVRGNETGTQSITKLCVDNIKSLIQ